MGSCLSLSAFFSAYSSILIYQYIFQSFRESGVAGWEGPPYPSS